MPNKFPARLYPESLLNGLFIICVSVIFLTFSIFSGVALSLLSYSNVLSLLLSAGLLPNLESILSVLPIFVEFKPFNILLVAFNPFVAGINPPNKLKPASVQSPLEAANPASAKDKAWPTPGIKYAKFPAISVPSLNKESLSTPATSYKLFITPDTNP